MVKTKSVNDSIDKSDGTRILLTRHPVRFQKHKPPFVMEWVRDLTPSTGPLKNWNKRRISWEKYESHHFKEMLGQRQKEKTKELAKRSKDETITLLCFEPEEDMHCHRHLLKELIENEECNV